MNCMSANFNQPSLPSCVRLQVLLGLARYLTRVSVDALQSELRR